MLAPRRGTGDMAAGDGIYGSGFGGVFHAALRRLHLEGRERPHIGRVTIVLVLIAWLPVMVLALFDPAGRAVATDLSMHARLLVGIPCVLAAEAVHAWTAEHALSVACDEAVAAPDRDRFRQLVADSARLRDARGVEVALLGIAITGGQLALWGVVPTAHLDGEHSPAGVWYAVVAIPLVQLLLLRFLWRWAVWSLLLVQLSRRPLALVATHPDHAGGIARLAEPTPAFALFAAGVCAVIAATMAPRMIASGSALAASANQLVALVVIAVAVAFAPLLPFTPALVRARTEYLVAYTRLSFALTREFDRRWIGGDRPAAAIVGEADVSSLTDHMSAFESLARTRVVVFGPRDVVVVVLAVLLPMLPLAFTTRSFADVFEMIGKAVLGGLPA